MAGILQKMRSMLWAQKIYYPLKNLEYELFFKKNPEKFLKKEYKKRVNNGTELNLENPQRLTEKLNWQKLYFEDEAMFRLGDKYYARQFVTEKVGEQYLVPMIDYFTDVNKFDVSKYPEKFVIKGTHNSGDVILCSDKTKLDVERTKKEIAFWLKKDFYKKSKEPSYKKAVPGIIIESYLESGKYTTPKDYKIFCFNGEPTYIGVYTDRYGANKKIGQIVYDSKWNTMPFIFGTTEKFERNENNIEEAPVCLEEMLDVSRKLAKGFPIVRVDLYVVDGKIYFGEMTFFHLNGYFQCTPQEWDAKMGEMVKLDCK